MIWCSDITQLLGDGEDEEVDIVARMKWFENKCFQNLNRLAALVRFPLARLEREVLCALITIDVHARDVVTDMVQHKVDKVRGC